MQQLNGFTNLVWYDWEITESCIQGLTPMCQLTRRLFNLPRLSAQTAGLPWMIAASTRLGNCVTVVKRQGPTQLSLSRDSSIGFTGAEIELLVDWLESPEFPCGLHTFLAKVEPAVPAKGPPLGPQVTNSAIPGVKTIPR